MTVVFKLPYKSAFTLYDALPLSHQDEIIEWTIKSNTSYIYHHWTETVKLTSLFYHGPPCIIITLHHGDTVTRKVTAPRRTWRWRRCVGWRRSTSWKCRRFDAARRCRTGRGMNILTMVTSTVCDVWQPLRWILQWRSSMTQHATSLQGDYSFSTMIFHDQKNEFPWPIGTA